MSNYDEAQLQIKLGLASSEESSNPSLIQQMQFLFHTWQENQMQPWLLRITLTNAIYVMQVDFHYSSKCEGQVARTYRLYGTFYLDDVDAMMS